MKKREFLSSILGQSTHSRKAKMASAPTPTAISLNEYTGDWTSSQAHHLLSRSCFGIKKSQLKDAIANGMNATVNQLLVTKPKPDPPIYYLFDGDPLAGIGETWVDKHDANNQIQGLYGARRRSLIAWFANLMATSGTSIHEKMAFFWHEHMPINNNSIGQYGYSYLSTLYEHAMGSFRTLLEEITVNPAMLIFLNGTSNIASSPNDNYARELLELFSIGRGDDQGNGDYTNYTEHDIAELARALTGWRHFRLEDGTHGSYFTPDRHDASDKVLSHRFDNVTISDGGENEYKTVIDIILQKEEVAKFICRKIHIYFVGQDITPEVEANIIGPMAELIRNDNYNIKTGLSALLRSEYFYDESIKGCMINNPYELVFKIHNSLEVPNPELLTERYSVAARFNWWGFLMQMTLLDAPTVAGWKAYYQAPQYYEYWINSVTLVQRETRADNYIGSVQQDGVKIQLDPLHFLTFLDNPTDPNAVVTETAELLFPFPLSQEQLDFLKGVLIPGLPDFEWTVEYSEYLADPENDALKTAVIGKLKNLFRTMLKMPEMYLQ